MRRNKLCKGSPLLWGSCTGQCPCSGHSHWGKQGWGEGSGEGMCSKRTTFPPHPSLFLSVMGESLLITSGAAVYLLGGSACQRFSEQGSRQLFLCATLSPVTENLLKQLLAGVSPCARGCAQAEQSLGGEGEPKPPSQCSQDQRACSGIFQLVPADAVPPGATSHPFMSRTWLFLLLPHHCKPGRQGCCLQQELGREAFCLLADSGGK